MATLDGELESREWIRWALRSDGPLFFRTPVALDSPIDRKDPRYKVLFESYQAVVAVTNMDYFSNLRVDFCPSLSLNLQAQLFASKKDQSLKMDIREACLRSSWLRCVIYFIPYRVYSSDG